MEIKPEEKFEKYREALKHEIIERLKDREKEINIAPAFFNTVINSLFHSYVLWIDKLCSPKSERGLFNYLKFIENNRKLFDRENWNKRRADKHRDPGKYQIDSITYETIKEDLELLSSLSIKEDIENIRHKYTAHFDKEYFYDKNKLRTEIKINIDDLMSTINVIKSIYNRYSVAYDGVQNTLEPYNINDIDYILDRLYKNG